MKGLIVAIVLLPTVTLVWAGYHLYHCRGR